jgi:hypothetical protein
VERQARLLVAEGCDRTCGDAPSRGVRRSWFRDVERLANSRIIPGLIPGLFAAKSDIFPCFVRFPCHGYRKGKL